MLDLVLIRVFNYIPPLCQWVLQEFPEPSQLISILFIEQYLQFVKSLIFCFMVVNRANNVICVKSFGTVSGLKVLFSRLRIWFVPIFENTPQKRGSEILEFFFCLKRANSSMCLSACERLVSDFFLITQILLKV